MNQNAELKKGFSFPLKAVAVLSILLLAFGIMNFGFMGKKKFASNPVKPKHSEVKKESTYEVNADSIESVQAFMKVYQVLMSPRCMNCHPSGDIPLQGDDSHLHTMDPQRGKDGKGIYAMKCSNCHQPANTPGFHTPPGNPKWHLPPADMKMVFQGKTPRQLALQIMDFKKNGHKNKQQLLEHARDTLVKAGWNMGEGRIPPPLSYDAFVAAWDTWIKKGAYAPKAK